MNPVMAAVTTSAAVLVQIQKNPCLIKVNLLWDYNRNWGEDN